MSPPTTTANMRDEVTITLLCLIKVFQSYSFSRSLACVCARVSVWAGPLVYFVDTIFFAQRSNSAKSSTLCGQEARGVCSRTKLSDWLFVLGNSVGISATSYHVCMYPCIQSFIRIRCVITMNSL